MSSRKQRQKKKQELLNILGHFECGRQQGFPEVLRESLDFLELSQAQFYRDAKEDCLVHTISPSSISGWLSGKRIPEDMTRHFLIGYLYHRIQRS